MYFSLHVYMGYVSLLPITSGFLGLQPLQQCLQVRSYLIRVHPTQMLLQRINLGKFFLAYRTTEGRLDHIQGRLEPAPAHTTEDHHLEL